MSETTRFIRLWQTEPEIRKKILDHQRERYASCEEFRAAKRAASRARYVPRGPRAARPLKPRSVQVGDQIIVVIGLGDAAKRLGVGKDKLRRYDDQGVIPANRYVDDKDRRWFPEAFIEWLKPLLADQPRTKAPLWRLKTRVEQAWQGAVGIPRLPQPETQPEREAHGEEGNGDRPGNDSPSGERARDSSGGG